MATTGEGGTGKDEPLLILDDDDGGDQSSAAATDDSLDEAAPQPPLIVGVGKRRIINAPDTDGSILFQMIKEILVDDDENKVLTLLSPDNEPGNVTDFASPAFAPPSVLSKPTAPLSSPARRPLPTTLAQSSHTVQAFRLCFAFVSLRPQLSQLKA